MELLARNGRISRVAGNNGRIRSPTPIWHGSLRTRAWKGDPFETPLWQIVLHVVNHATLHRGQVMAMLRQLGIPPPPTDLISYYRSLPSER